MQALGLNAVLVVTVLGIFTDGCQVRATRTDFRKSGRGAEAPAEGKAPETPAGPSEQPGPAPAPKPAPAPQPAPTPVPDPAAGTAFKNAEEAAVAVCMNPRGSTKRNQALDYFDQHFKAETRAYDRGAAAGNHDHCVNSLLPAAIWVNLKIGITVGTGMGQAILETGWCRNSLAKNSLNFHGMKKPYKNDYPYRYWKGAATGGWMKFNHPDGAFFSMGERFFVKRLPYKGCLPKRENAQQFISCIGPKWAMSGSYAGKVMKIRNSYNSKKYPGLKFPNCELNRSEWRLENNYKQYL